MTDKAGNKHLEKWNQEIYRKLNREDGLERVYFSGQRKILQLKREMNSIQAGLSKKVRKRHFV